MTCRDDAPHSQGCPCWNAKVRADAYEECARLIDYRALLAGPVLADRYGFLAKTIRALAAKHRLEAGEAALRDT